MTFLPNLDKMVRQEPGSRKKASKTSGRKFFLREAEDKTGLGLLLLEGPSHIETVLKSTFSDPEVRRNPGLNQILTKVGQEVWPIFRRLGWRSRPHKTIIGQFTFTAPGFTLETAVEGVTKYDTYCSLGKAFLEDGDEKMVERAERGDLTEERSPSETSEVQTIMEEEEKPQRDQRTEVNSLSENSQIKIARARTTSAMGNNKASQEYISSNLETVLKKTFSDPEVQVNPSLEPLLNKVGQKVWPIFKKVGWRSRPHKTILGEFTFTAPGYTLEAAVEGETKYNTFSALGKSFLEEGDEKMLLKARIRSPSKTSHKKTILDEREDERFQNSPRGDRNKARSTAENFQGKTFLEEGDEKMLGRPPREDTGKVRTPSETYQRRTLLEEGDEEMYERVPQYEIDSSQSYNETGRTTPQTRHGSSNVNIDIFSDSGALENHYEGEEGSGLCAVAEVPSIEVSDSNELKAYAPIPLKNRARSTPNASNRMNLDSRLEALEEKMLARLKKTESTEAPAPTDILSLADEPSLTDEPPLTEPPIIEVPSPIEIMDIPSEEKSSPSQIQDDIVPSQNEAPPNGLKKSTLNTRVEAMEELVFDDGQARDGRIVSRIKEMEKFIFDSDYKPPKNLTSRVNALAQEFELDF